MFRLFAFSVTFIGVLSIGSAQSLSDLKMTLPSLEERYKMDYDIQGLFNPSADTLADLNLEQYEELRQVDNDVEVYESNEANLYVERRALIDFNDSALEVHQVVSVGDFLYYDNVEYEVVAFTGQNFWIRNWSDGDMAGITVEIRRRLANRKTGQFGYKGLNLVTSSNHESEFDIQNGSNPPMLITDDNKFKENFMFEIDGEFFRIVEWNGTNVKLSGRDQYWTTNTEGGTNVSYNLVHFPKIAVNIGFTVFSELDRDGNDPVIRTIEDSVGNLAIVALSSGSTGMQENVGQEEGISFTIETKSGNISEGIVL